MRDVAVIVRTLKGMYSHGASALAKQQKTQNPFRVLVSCIISLRTKDAVTEAASERIFKLAATPKEMMKLSKEKIAEAIYPAGFYKTKAMRIRDISKQLYEQYSSQVPDTIEELVEFKGVGRKTANIVLVFGFGKPAVPVDTHVHKISNRLGWVTTRTPEQTEIELRKHLPKRYWLEINELFVRHGQQVCLSVSPWCSRCSIARYCKKDSVTRSR